MIGILDYGMGNLHSVYHAFKKAGLNPVISNDPKELESCSHLVLPGVGAFGDMMKALKEQELDAWLIRQVNEKQKKLLGICLGMQALYESSMEKGKHEGLGLLQGEVIAMDDQDGSLRIPQIGWNRLEISQDSLKNLYQREPFYYFDHSYYASGTDPEEVLAVVHHGPYEIPAVVGKGNVLGVQGHPEKSSRAGLALLQWFGKDDFSC